MENIIYAIVAAAFYWTFMIAAVAILAQHVTEPKRIWWVIGIAATWPLFAIATMVALPYGSLVASTKRIRVDLHNRKLLREFEDWIRERDNGKISPKE